MAERLEPDIRYHLLDTIFGIRMFGNLVSVLFDECFKFLIGPDRMNLNDLICIGSPLLHIDQGEDKCGIFFQTLLLDESLNIGFEDSGFYVMQNGHQWAEGVENLFRICPVVVEHMLRPAQCVIHEILVYEPHAELSDVRSCEFEEFGRVHNPVIGIYPVEHVHVGFPGKPEELEHLMKLPMCLRLSVLMGNNALQ